MLYTVIDSSRNRKKGPPSLVFWEPVTFITKQTRTDEEKCVDQLCSRQKCNLTGEGASHAEKTAGWGWGLVGRALAWCA